MPVEGGQGKVLAIEAEVDLTGRLVDVLDALDGGAHRSGARLVKRHERTGHSELRVRLVGRRSRVLNQQRVFRVPRPDNILSASLGQFDHGVPGREVDSRPFGNGPEGDGTAGPARVQLLPGPEQAFAGAKNHADVVVLNTPGARHALQDGGRGAQPVEMRDGQEAVRIGAVPFVGGVPLLPGGSEGFSVSVRRHDCSCWR